MAHVEVASAVSEIRIELVRQSDYRFEECCVVTQSLRLAFPVDVRALDQTGAVLHSS